MDCAPPLLRQLHQRFPRLHYASCYSSLKVKPNWLRVPLAGRGIRRLSFSFVGLLLAPSPTRHAALRNAGGLDARAVPGGLRTRTPRDLGLSMGIASHRMVRRAVVRVAVAFADHPMC